ncbi:cytochrome c-type biogenesis protein CcmF [Candidatus Nitrosoglobus terrae]|uniref:Cytochrome c-type biogenesis protein CcmF n=1 Tax=Candidatus Nitrosoglobus terrae TaxID=1630141 RepID=A0A1Q2SNU1_9GAMM|nr:heme lyase CcmF/NrfE family subunit [Candidatus Nitrosoglobus terrae]BAW80825.1 cytochrome c-type biogenesis protein CcmF [Candidatus Nitrosoglobus terrae]
MIPELGHLALILALTLALSQAILPLVGAQRGIVGWMNVARTAAYGQCFFIVIAFASLATSFITNDFSVAYVASNSNSALPIPYRFAAIWGSHEGSLMLWSLILSFWTVAVARFSRSIPLVYIARVLAIMGIINVGFLLFMILTSNPFLRLFPAPLDGQDLNPLLQDPGLVIHPPMLYMGYVGFSVVFSFAIAALIGKRLDAAWARWSRPWTVVAWLFLSIGITLGSWWAYYELGWGGWWFWDPVENASFMPWLVGTALIHSLAVTEKRDAFKRWTVLLAIFAFSLSLLGTFLVRSGVLTSVHAFASDPARGIFILFLLGITVGGSLLLYALRAPLVLDTGRFHFISREGFLLANNVVLVVAAGSVLLGTLYPLILEGTGLGKISVGPPYFNTVFIPLMLILAFLLGMGIIARWKQQSFWEIVKRRGLVFIVCVAIGISIPYAIGHEKEFNAIAGITVAVWVTLTTLLGIWNRSINREGAIAGILSLSRNFVGMSLAHLGFAISIVGITITSIYGLEQDVGVAIGEGAKLGAYEFRLDSIHETNGPNYRATEGSVSILKNGELITTLQPQKRIYRVQTSPMTEAGIDAGLFRDLFVALGESLGENKWSLRIQYKPFVRWIWLGGLFMAFGGALAASDRRYRIGLLKKAKRKTTQPIANTTAAVAEI